jgi:DNA-binding NarL/FixJ family response regulator
MLASAVIAEDHDLTRQGLRLVLEDYLDMHVAATTRNGLEVVDLLEEHAADLLLLDLALPGLNGLDVLHKIQERGLSVTVVIVSMHSEDAYVAEAFQRGAAGYILKGAPVQEMIDGIKTVMQGDRYLSDGLPESVLDLAEEGLSDRYDTLTEREREVLQLTAEGLTSREIGETLHISPRTAEKHRENIKSKLELSSTAEMVRFVMQRSPMPDDLPSSSDE